MPSPATSSASAQPDQPTDASLRQSQSASSLQNGSHQEGAVQHPDSTTNNDGPDVPVDSNDIIREGKEKAKAVMAASGVKIQDEAAQTSASGAETASPAPSRTANGTSPSRKRSRSGSRIPSQAPSQEAPQNDQPGIQEYLLNQYITRDMLHAVAVNDQEIRGRDLSQEKKGELEYYANLRHQRQVNPGSIFGFGYAGFGNGLTNAKPGRLQYPADRRRPGNRRSKLLHISKKDGLQQAEQIEELIPVRLDIEHDKIKLRDTFTWNLHDRVTPTEVFAENLVEDFKLPPELRILLLQEINKEMLAQIQDFYPHVFIDEEPLDPQLPYMAYKNDEMRILIKLNITIGQHTLVDQFEWEINNPLNSPEEFARQMARDLSLSGEFTTAIAHSIREQCQMFTKSLYITGHPFDGRPIEDADVRDSFLPSPLPSVFRPMQAAKDYTPYLYELNEAELERTELSIMREQRRQKRSVNRRGGPALPDLKDRQRTVRSLVVSSVLPGASESLEGSRIFKVSRSTNRRSRAAGRTDGADDSDDSDSDDSAPDSPAPSQIMGGTARTRGIRGAATAAQAAMRANLGRSATPELSALHHHETRTSARRVGGGYDTREESVAEPTTFVVRLRINPRRFQQFLQTMRSRPASEYPQRTVSTPLMTSQNATPQRSTPTVNSMPPPPSPAMPPRSVPNASPRMTAAPGPGGNHDWKYYPDGRADAPWPPSPQSAPPPPWLTTVLQELRVKYPNDNFEATMRFNVVDEKQQTIKLDTLDTQAPLPAGLKAQYLPRIRCNDCPGKLYTAGPGLTVENFEVHLDKNRHHKAAVERRIGRPSAS